MRRVAAGAAGVLLLAGCGGAAHRTAAPPPVRAVDEALPQNLQGQLDGMLGLPQPKGSDVSVSEMCVVKLTAKMKPRPCTPAEIAAGRVKARRFEQAIVPAQAEAPRVVAALRLPYGFRELLIAWWTRSGRLCMSTAGVSAGNMDEPFGPCVAAADRAAGYPADPRNPPCGAVCLSVGNENVAGTNGYYLAGTVPPGATALRVTVGGGSVTTYPLRGPLIPGTHRRVFMAETGAHAWRRLEILSGKTVVATQEMPPREAAFQDCEERYAASDFSKLRACSAKARALPGP